MEDHSVLSWIKNLTSLVWMAIIPNGNHYIVNDKREPFGKIRLRNEWFNCILVTEFEDNADDKTDKIKAKRFNHPMKLNISKIKYRSV